VGTDPTAVRDVIQTFLTRADKSHDDLTDQTTHPYPTGGEYR